MTEKRNHTYPVSTTLDKANLNYSGKYKIVVDINNKLFLDDYNGNRREIDTFNDFLTQVANFLKVSSNLVDKTKVDYGFRQNGKILKLHVPTFLSDDGVTPKFALMGQYTSQEVNEENKYDKIELIKFVDFKKVGIDRILDDILFDNDYNYNVFLNLDEEFIELYGYDLTDCCYTTKKIDSNEYQTILTDTDDLHDYIGKLFSKHGLINPRYINFEFEFDKYKVPQFNLGKFFGFIDTDKNISDNVIANQVNIDTYTHKHVFEPVPDHFKTVYQSKIDELILTDTYVTLEFQTVNAGDVIEIFGDDGDGYKSIYRYIVHPDDIGESLNESLQNIRRNIDYGSKFLIEHYGNKLRLASNYFYDVFVKTEIYVKVSTDDGSFITKKKEDIKTYVDVPIDDVKVFINDVEYPVVKKYHEIVGNKKSFYYRLDTTNRSVTFQDKVVVIKQRLKPTYYNLVGMNHHKFGLIINYYENCNKSKYIKLLKQKFPTYNTTIDLFKNSILNYVEQIPFVDVEKEIPKSVVELENNININGTTSYCLPNVLNYDKQFYVEDANLDFHWFLINSKPPKYLNNKTKERFVGGLIGEVIETPDGDDISQLHLDNIKLKSILKTKNRISKYCECIFLGVRYLMDYRLNNYEFAVVHMPNLNKNNYDEHLYKLHVNHDKRQVILLINKFMLFVDLIRGGDIDAEPVIDLTLYYTVDRLYTSNPDHLKFITRRGGLLLCDDKIPVRYKGLINMNTWRHYDTNDNKWYICLKNNVNVNIEDLNGFLPKNGDVEFYHYNVLEKFGKIIAIRYKLINIVDLHPDYVWCENLLINFFESDELYIDINNFDAAQFKKIENYQLVSTDPNKIEITVNINETDETRIIFNPTEQLNFKKDYYECAVNNMENVFKFPENTMTNDAVIEKLKNLLPLALNNPNNNNKYLSDKVTMFHRNQMWFLNKHLIANNAYFKYENFKQIRKEIKDLTVERLRLFLDANLITASDGKEYKVNITKKDVGLTYWKFNETNSNGEKIQTKKITKILRNRGMFKPTFEESKLQYFNLMCYNGEIVINMKINNIVFNYKNGLAAFLADREANFNVDYFLSKYYELSALIIDNKKIDYKSSENSKDDLIVDKKYLNKNLQLIFKRKTHAAK